MDSTLRLHNYYVSIPTPTNLNGKIFDQNNNAINEIRNLSRINIFLGANNSGKSRLLREIIRNYIPRVSYPDWVKTKLDYIGQDYSKKILSAIANSLQFGASFNPIAPFSLHSSGTEILNSQIFAEALNFAHNSYNIIDSTAKLASIKAKIKSINGFTQATRGYGIIQQNLTSLENSIEELINEIKIYLPPTPYNRIYIPSTRTLRTYANLAGGNDGLKQLIANDYSFKLTKAITPIANDESINIETGQDFYSIVFEYKNSELTYRKKIEDFEKFLSQNFFENKEVTIVAYNKLREIHIKIGEEKEQPIFHLGDGLQMLLILTFPLFIFDRGIIVIEEPELFIHPGLQKKFIDLLLTYEKAKNFMFFIASHSNHIIDTSQNIQDISIFTVQKFIDSDEKGDEKLSSIILTNVGFKNHTALSTLGVSNSSVYLANCTIWVEGATDRMYFARFIQIFLEKCKADNNSKYDAIKLYEGIHYSFVYSAGDTIVHWNFEDDPSESSGNQIIAKNLCGRALVVVDQDNGKNIARKQKLENDLGMRFYELPVVEVENLLSYDTISQTIKTYSTWKDLDLSNIKKPTQDEMETIRLGSLIDNNILLNQPKENRKRFSKTDTRIDKRKKPNLTLGNKIDFCERSLEFINQDNITAEAITVIERILDFVIEHNRF